MTIESHSPTSAIDEAASASSITAKQSLDRSLVRSIAWTGVVKWTTQILTWVSTVIVARVLTPADYGLVAIASTIINFITMINEFGLGTAVVTNRMLTARQVGELNCLAVLLGIGGFVVSSLMAFPLSQFFGAPELAWVLIAMGASFLIAAIRTVPTALLEKDLQFKSLALVEGGQAILASVVVMAMALLGWGYWALVIGLIVGTCAWTLFTLLYRSHPFHWPVFRSLSDTIAFSWHLVAMRVAWYIASNADRLIAGKILGQAAVGSYTFASTLASTPIEKVTGLVNRVTPAFFSTMQTDYVALRRYIVNLTEGLAMVTFPAATGLALVANDCVLLLLGEQWSDVVVPLQLLAAYGAFRAIMTLLSPTLLVTGLSRLGMLNSFWSLFVLIPAFYVGSWWGINGVAAAWIFGHPLVTIPLYSQVFRKIELPIRPYLRALWPATSGCGVMVAVVLGIQTVLPPSLPLVIHLIVLSTLGAATYALTAWVFHRARVMAFVELARKLQS